MSHTAIYLHVLLNLLFQRPLDCSYEYLVGWNVNHLCLPPVMYCTSTVNDALMELHEEAVTRELMTQGKSPTEERDYGEERYLCGWLHFECLWDERCLPDWREAQPWFLKRWLGQDAGPCPDAVCGHPDNLSPL